MSATATELFSRCDAGAPYEIGLQLLEDEKVSISSYTLVICDVVCLESSMSRMS